MQRATSFWERENSSKRSVMYSERVLPFGRLALERDAPACAAARERVREVGRDLVAVLLTAASRFAPLGAFPSARSLRASRATGRFVVGSAVVTAENALRLTNRNLIAFDLALGSGALLAPDVTLRILGHDEPSEDARHLFRRCGPIWLTYAAAHLVAERRGEPRDWWALAWLRGSELATDVVWSRSPAFTRPGARSGLWLAGAFNLTFALGFGWLASRAS
jgi:hypothetical protein